MFFDNINKKFLSLIIIILISFFNLNLINEVKAEITNSDMLCPLTSNQDFKLGDIHEDIRVLQKYLNKEGYVLANSGPGSVGRETNYFGNLTSIALTRFQKSKSINTNNLGVYDLATRNYLNCNNTFNYENKLIKYNNSTKVYKVENNKKRWIIDEATFNYYKFDWNNILLTNKFFETGQNIEIKDNGVEYVSDDQNKIYTLAGKITGLNYDIILKNIINNDEITIKPNQSSNFVFSKKLALAEEYDINIINNNNQKCYIEKNIGIIKNNVDNIEVMCGDIVTLNYNPLTFIPSSLPQYSLTYIAGANGTLTGQTTQSVTKYESGSPVTAVPNSYYNFLNWSDGSTDNPRTDTNIQTSLSVTANFAIDTYIINYLANSNGTISGSSTQQINHGGDTSSVTAVPNANYHFVDWDDGSTINPRIDTNVTSSDTFRANFAINSYLVTFKDHDNTILSTLTVNHGSPASAPIDPTRIGYTFNTWDTDYSSITTTTTITATYSINSYTISFNSEGGSAVSPITQDYDTVITPPADPTKTGYTFSTWTPSLPDTMPEYSATHTAIWDINYYTVTFVDYNSDFISSSSVAYNSSTTPPSDPTRIGYTFTGWDSSDYLNVTSDLTIQATYIINTFTVNYTAGLGGTISGNASQTVDYNSSTTQVVAIPDSGYTFINWNDSFAIPTRTDSNISDNATYTARFGFINISSPTNSEEIVIDTEFIVTGTTHNIDQIIIEASTNTIDWVLLNSTSTLSNTFSATSTLSSSNFSAGVSTTIRVKSVNYNHVYDEVEVMVGSGYFTKLQISGGYNWVSGVKYDESTESFFITGFTKTSNFLGSGVTVNTSYNNPFITKYDKDGNLVWVKVRALDTNNSYYSAENNCWIDGDIVYTTYGRGSSSWNYGFPRVLAYTKAGNYVSFRDWWGVAHHFRIVGKIGTDLIYVGVNDGNSLVVLKTPSNLSAGFSSITSGSGASLLNTKNFTAKLDPDNNDLLISGVGLESNIQEARVFRIPYQSGTYNLSGRTIEFRNNTGQNYPFVSDFTQDFTLGVTNLSNNLSYPTVQYLFNNSERNQIVNLDYNSARKIDKDGQRLFVYGNNSVSELNTDNYNPIWTVSSTPAVLSGESDSIIFGNKLLLYGYTNGNFDGNNEGNSTRNGIVWIINKNGN